MFSPFHVGRFLSLFLAIATVVLSPAATAGQDRWTQIGPVGAPMFGIATDRAHPEILYANDGKHLFKSSDTGTTWRPTLALPVTLPISSSTCQSSYYVHPADGSIFASACGGLFHSRDADSSWQSLSSQAFSIIGGDPSNGLVVYGLTYDQGEAGSLLKSTDGGITWSPVAGAWPGGGVAQILVDATDPSIAYAFGPSGAFRSTDAGAHWLAVNSGLPASAIVGALQIGSTLVIATADFGIYRSVNRAMTWTSANVGLANLQAIALAASQGPVPSLYVAVGAATAVSVFRSVDGGNTWAATGPLGTGNVTGMAASGQSVIATVTDGIAVSNDGGTTWHMAPPNSSLPNTPVGSMLIDAGDPQVLYTGRYGSDDGGKTWTPNGFYTLATSPTRTGVVYGQTYEPCGEVRATLICGAVRSTDFGITWTLIFHVVPIAQNSGAKTVRESAPNPNRIAMVVSGDPPTRSPFLQTSDDWGATWKEASLGLPQALTLGPIALGATDTQTMYAGVDNLVYKTIDGGNLWVGASNGLDVANVVGIAINPAEPNIVYAATAPTNTNDASVGGLYVSFDGGATWVFNQNLGHVALTAIVLDPHRPSTLYVGSDGQGVFRSSDAGQTWTAISNGLLTADALRVRMVAVDSADSRNLYAATDAGAFALTLVTFDSLATVIEYYSPEFDDYFITLVPDEIHALDTQRGPGWYRTGYTFEAYIEPTPGADPLCRFYIPPASHFFSASAEECAANLARNVPPFVFESSASFYLPSPDLVTGACPSGTIPIYRLYNNKPSAANHRYTTDLAVKAKMVAKGYISEGYGPNGVIMCAPN